MDHSQNDFTSGHYAPRAQDYVTSTVHSSGEDLAQIERALRDRSYRRVLDLGCGGGHVSYCAAPHVGAVVACDITPAMLDTVAETAAERGLSNVTIQQAAAEKLPFGAASFDAVLCRFSAHHWQDMEAGLREARRVLVAGGLAIFIDVVAPASAVLDTHLQAVEVLRDPSHVRNYGLAEWVAALSRAGFALETATVRKLRMEFAAWIARTRTAPSKADAIRTLQDHASTSVRSHFGIGNDGSFDLESVTMVARAF